MRTLIFILVFSLVASVIAADSTPRRDSVSVALTVFGSPADEQVMQTLRAEHIPISSGGVDLGIRWYEVPRDKVKQVVTLLRDLDPSGTHIVIVYPKPPTHNGKAVLPK